MQTTNVKQSTEKSIDTRLSTGLLRYPDLASRIEPNLMDRVRKIMDRNGEIQTQGKKV